MEAHKEKLNYMAKVLAEVGLALVSNGANSTRSARNLQRIANGCGYNIEEFFSHSALVITVEDKRTGEMQTVTKRIGHYGVNYSIVSEISILSWDVAKNKLSPAQIEAELQDILKMPIYSQLLKCLWIGIASAALARVFDGGLIDFIVAFASGMLGFWARKIVLDKKFNTNIGWFVGAFVSAAVVNLLRRFGLGDLHSALTACVLWLIPGVPLINGGLDLMNGHVVSGSAKLAMGFMLVFMIAVGFYGALFLFGYGGN